jgi:hypothetical protein
MRISTVVLEFFVDMGIYWYSSLYVKGCEYKMLSFSSTACFCSHGGAAQALSPFPQSACTWVGPPNLINIPVITPNMSSRFSPSGRSWCWAHGCRGERRCRRAPWRAAVVSLSPFLLISPLRLEWGRAPWRAVVGVEQGRIKGHRRFPAPPPPTTTTVAGPVRPLNNDFFLQILLLIF